MVIRRLHAGRRWGGALAETGVIIGLVAMIVFGVFEYARLLMDWNLLNNAAREGCRYALANNTSTTITTSVQSIATNYMAGETKNFNNFTVSVSGTHLGVSTAVNSLEPGDPITVTVSGTYKFMNIVPFIHMPTSLVITSGVTMLCEGGT
jgi:Flp pilus assembly protein TadG